MIVSVLSHLLLSLSIHTCHSCVRLINLDVAVVSRSTPLINSLRVPLTHTDLGIGPELTDYLMAMLGSGYILKQELLEREEGRALLREKHDSLTQILQSHNLSFPGLLDKISLRLVSRVVVVQSLVSSIAYSRIFIKTLDRKRGRH